MTYGGLDIPKADYVATNGTTVVLDDGAVVGTIVRIVAFQSFVVANTYTQSQADTLLAAKANSPLRWLSRLPLLALCLQATWALVLAPETTRASKLRRLVEQQEHYQGLTKGTDELRRSVTRLNSSYTDYSGYEYITATCSKYVHPICRYSAALTTGAPSGSARLLLERQIPTEAGITNTAMTIDNAGIVTKPLQPAFLAQGAQCRST